VVILPLSLKTFGRLVIVTDVIFVNCCEDEEASIYYASGVSTALQTIVKVILTFFSFFIRWTSEGIASGDRLQNRLLFAEVGCPVIFMLIFKTILFSILKLMAEACWLRIGLHGANFWLFEKKGEPLFQTALELIIHNYSELYISGKENFLKL